MPPVRRCQYLDCHAAVVNGEATGFSAENVALIGALVYRYPDLLPVLAEHLEDMDGEVLPYLVMADVIRWLVAHHPTQPDRTREIIAWLEEAFDRGPDEVKGLIGVGGVEMIPDPGEPGAELRELLGPSLRDVDPWNPSYWRPGERP